MELSKFIHMIFIKDLYLYCSPGLLKLYIYRVSYVYLSNRTRTRTILLNLPVVLLPAGHRDQDNLYSRRRTWILESF